MCPALYHTDTSHTTPGSAPTTCDTIQQQFQSGGAAEAGLRRRHTTASWTYFLRIIEWLSCFNSSGAHDAGPLLLDLVFITPLPSSRARCACQSCYHLVIVSSSCLRTQINSFSSSSS